MKIYKYFVTILGKNVQVLVALLMGLVPMDMEFVVFVSNFNAGRVLPRLEPRIKCYAFQSPYTVLILIWDVINLSNWVVKSKLSHSQFST